MKKKQLGLSLLFLAFCAVFAIYYLSYQKNQDTKPPILKCETDRIIASVNITEEELLTGITAMDDVDGDLTSEILIEEITDFKEGVRTIRYAAVDSSNNIGRIARELVYEDYKHPEFSLKQPLIFYIGESYNLLDIINASDVLDGDITIHVRLTCMPQSLSQTRVSDFRR